jgi:hypothetical protein
MGMAVMNEPEMHEGLGPIERIVVMENHDAAYRVWRDAGAAPGGSA